VSSDSRSVLSRAARAPDLTDAYGPEADHVIDVWYPAAGHQHPVLLIFFHGGFWRAEYDRAHVAPLAEALAGAGFIVATPEYLRTGGGGGWPETFADVRAAIPAAAAMVADRSPRAVLVSGHSAGGHLALWAAGENLAIDAVVTLAPVADLRTAHELDLDDGAVADLLGGGPEDVPDRYAEADPMARLPLRVPVGLVHGDRDRQVPVSFSQRYAENARAAGTAVRLDVLTGVDHFAVIDPQSSAWPAVMAAFTEITEPPKAR
jgi:acetyl esterase/lipase